MKKINIPYYTDADLVRLELLAYPTPEDLHPVEHNWRELARKLLEHTKELQNVAIELNEAVANYQKVDIKLTKFPGVFNPNYNAITISKI